MLTEKPHLRRCASSLVTAAYSYVRLIPKDLRAPEGGISQAQLASGAFPQASQFFDVFLEYL